MHTSPFLALGLLAALAVLRLPAPPDLSLLDDQSSTSTVASEVVIVHTDGARFAGTLVAPAGPGPHPAALLVSPGGEHPRDELRHGTEHWKVLARELASRGIATLRVDNRGIGGSATGRDPEWSNAWTFEDQATDLAGHLAWLSARVEIDRNRVGLVAHGDGTFPAMIAAGADRGIAFAILLSASGLSGAHIIAGQLDDDGTRDPDQLEALRTKFVGALEGLAEHGGTPEVVERVARALKSLGFEAATADAAAASFVAEHDTPWHRSWIGVDPCALIGAVRVPCLVLLGEEDERLDVAASSDALGEALLAASAYEARVEHVPGADHFLEDAERLGRLVNEVVARIAGWIADTTGTCEESLLPRGRAGAAPELLITGVSVVDVLAGELLEERDVLLRDGRIVRIAPAASTPRQAGTADGVRIVEGAGRFLMPGMWDMHVHTTFWGADALALFVARGVTGVRDMGGDAEAIDGWREAIAAGELLGPTIFRAGPFLDGPKPNFQWRRMVEDAAAAEAAVVELEKHGADFIKVHSRLPRAALVAAVARAHELGLPVVGHVPVGMLPIEVAELGFASLEHVDTLLSGLARAEGSPASNWDQAYLWWQGPDGERAMKRLAELGTRVTPTLVVHDRLRARMNPRFGVLEEWLSVLTRRLHESGVALVTGTDVGRRVTGIEPGTMLPRELELLVSAGLSPAEALWAATLEPARLLGLADSGLVAEGMRADLILLERNPLTNVGATRDIVGVLLAGHFYTADDLASIVEQAQRAPYGVQGR